MTEAKTKTVRETEGEAQAPSRIALVTGASRGIGMAVALALAQSGVHVIATGRDTAALESLDDAIAACGGSATLAPHDLADRPATMRLAKSIHKRWGRLDILVANAGSMGTITPLAHMDEGDWDTALDTNLSSVWRLIRVLEPLLRLSDSGRAILVLAESLTAGYPAYRGALNAGKAGLRALGMTWAAEVAQTDMKVNMLDPGEVATAQHAAAFPGIDAATLPRPEDIAPAFLKLAAPDCTDNGKVFGVAELMGGDDA